MKTLFTPVLLFLALSIFAQTGKQLVFTAYTPDLKVDEATVEYVGNNKIVSAYSNVNPQVSGWQAQYIDLLETDLEGNVLLSKRIELDTIGFYVSRAGKCKDGGYFVVGQNANYSNANACFIRLNQAGNFMWSTTFKVANASLTVDGKGTVIEDNDGNFFISHRKPLNLGICKINAGGTLQWNKTWQIDTMLTVAENIAPSGDGGVAFAGFSRHGHGMGVINGDGSIRFFKFYRKGRYGLVTFPHEVGSLIKLRDGGYLSGGTAPVSGMIICRFDNQGSLLFEKRLKVNEPCNAISFHDVIEHNNGKLTVLGTNGDNFMLHLDADGNQEYRKNVFSGGWNKWLHLSEEQGLFYVCGFRNQPFGASDTAYIGVNFATHLGNFCDSTVYSFTVRDSTASSVYDASIPMREVSIGAATPMNVTVQNRDFSVYVYERCTMSNGFAPFDDAVPNSLSTLKEAPEVFIFPNPVSSSLTISGLQTGNYEVTLFTAEGEKVFESQLNGNSPHVDLQALTSGLYFLETKNLNSQHKTVSKVVVSR